MSKFTKSILVLALVFLANACGSDSDSNSSDCEYPLNNKAISFNQAYNETIATDEEKGYTFSTITAGNYTIDVSGVTSDITIELFEYVSGCSESYDNLPEILSFGGTPSNPTSEPAVLEASKKYQIRIYEIFGDSIFTLQVND